MRILRFGAPASSRSPKKMSRILAGVLFMLFLAHSNLWAAPTVMEVLQKMDEVENLGADITVKFSLTETRRSEI